MHIECTSSRFSFSGKDVPRPHRSMSERVVSQPQSRLSSARRASKAAEISAKKTAFQASEYNTDTESIADAPASAPTTRRRAQDIQSRLGRGRPVIAGGSGARNITKVISRGTGRKGKTVAMLQEYPIPERGMLLPMYCLAEISNGMQMKILEPWMS
jgi:hypothetical protein